MADAESNKQRVLIGCTGSVATIKLNQLISELMDTSNFDLKVITTEHSEHFFDRKDLPVSVEVFCDKDEWSMWKGRGDPVLHIELSKWADLLLIAPLDANTLAKIAQGLCDNLLTCTVRAWNIKKPLLFCPAMNTQMWEHPITSTHVKTLEKWGYEQIPCVSKTLMCGDTGMGGMADISTIVATVLKSLKISL